MKRSPITRGKGLARGASCLTRSRLKPISDARREREPDAAELAEREAWRLATENDPVCARCGGHTGRMDGHHVVLRSHLAKRGAPLWSLDNRLTLHHTCHLRHHAGTDAARVRIDQLRPENLAFARALLGDAAEDYLARHYAPARVEGTPSAH